MQVPLASGPLSQGAATDIYRFNAAAGDRLFFDAQSSQSGIYWRLVDPYDRQIFLLRSSIPAALQIGAAGTYTLLVEGSISNGTGPLNYSLSVQKIADTTTPLTLGAEVDGAITQVGQQNHYTFTLAESTELYFDSLTSDSGFTWSLVGPAGTGITARGFGGSDGNSVSDPICV